MIQPGTYDRRCSTAGQVTQTADTGNKGEGSNRPDDLRRTGSYAHPTARAGRTGRTGRTGRVAART
jgi:hypothetical protein